MVNFFIGRPIFATVLALLMLLVGGICVFILPISLYPDIVPPQVQVTTTFTGADAQTVADTVTTPVEQQINGVKGLIYFNSDSTSNGLSNVIDDGSASGGACVRHREHGDEGGSSAVPAAARGSDRSLHAVHPGHGPRHRVGITLLDQHLERIEHTVPDSRPLQCNETHAGVASLCKRVSLRLAESYVTCCVQQDDENHDAGACRLPPSTHDQRSPARPESARSSS